MTVSADLFTTGPAASERIVEGMHLLRARASSAKLLPGVEAVVRDAPFRHLETPGGGRMSVAMTNCGTLGWVSDRRGYRYQATDPMTGLPWPKMPAAFLQLATDAASECGFANLQPDVCLINRYRPGSSLGAHQDRDEGSMEHPIVSVSLGLPATFLLYGTRRGGRARRIALHDGDVLVFGGPARRVYHGVGVLAKGDHPLTGQCRINLTFRRAR